MITKLDGLRGKAEVLGVIRTFDWEEGECLRLYGLDLAEAEAVINRVSAGGIKGIKPPERVPYDGWQGTIEPGGVATVAEREKPIEEVKNQEQAAPQPEPQKETASPAPKQEKKVAEAPKKEEPPPAPPVLTVQEKAPLKQAVQQVDEEEEQEIPFGKTNGHAQNGNKKVLVVDIEQIKDAPSLGDVVVYLYEHGVDTVSDIVLKCHELRQDIPLLAKISNLSQRVAKACEVKGLDVKP